MHKPLFDENGQPCGCMIDLGDDPHGAQEIIYCPQHKPAWRVEMELLIRLAKKDVEEGR